MCAKVHDHTQSKFDCHRFYTVIVLHERISPYNDVLHETSTTVSMETKLCVKKCIM